MKNALLRRSARSSTFLLLLVFVGLTVIAHSAAEVPRRPFLFKDTRSELAAARARGQHDVLVVIASMPGTNARAANLVATLDGQIQFRDDDVDYIRARVPVKNVERLASDKAVHCIDVSMDFNIGRIYGPAERRAFLSPASTMPTAETESSQQTWPPVFSDHPLSHRYSPLADMGAEEFRKANPTFDGRGVTIAMIDDNPDPLLPELQIATTLDGKPTTKIAVYETAINATEEDDGRWVRMNYTVETQNGKFTYQKKAYTAPKAGTYRIGILDESRFGQIEKDINRDGNPPNSCREFGVLWDEASNDVWVDTNQDGNFADEKALTDYSVRPEFGVFGIDKPETPMRESVGFGVQIDRVKKLVGLNLGTAWHASLVIGAALASHGTSGRFDGVAPGARLASVSGGGSSYGHIEAAIKAIKNPLVDIVFFEQYFSVSHAYNLRDGRQVPAVIFGRLIAKYKKLIVVPTHNFPMLCGVDDMAAAEGALAIGAHESAENFLTNRGVRVEHKDNLHITGGYGPMGDGALKPDILAPSNHLSTNRGFDKGTALPGVYYLPPGYSIAGGTSTATPTATGAVALLISAAKQKGISYDAFRIKKAITMSARYIDHLPAYKQGNGVINVAGAWEILKELDKSREPVTIISRAPVRHVYSHLLATPNEGVGLYEREGWRAGAYGERTITFTRIAGPSAPMTFALSWTGNDDATFSSPPSITLPLGKPVPVVLTISPTKPGVHSAILTLDNPSVPGHAYRMLATIVAAEQLTAANAFTIEKKAEVPRPGMQSFFFNVPEGLSALRFEQKAEKRTVRLSVIRPDTIEEKTTYFQDQKERNATIAITDPVPGVWEVRLTDIDDTRTYDWEQAMKPEPVPPTQVTLTISGLSLEATVLDRREEFAQASAKNRETTFDLSISNKMAKFTGCATSAPLGSARREHRVILEKEQQVFEVEVLPGSTALMVRVFNPSDPKADIDIYVFDETSGKARGFFYVDENGKMAQSGSCADARPVGEESVIVRSPTAGKWKIVVDAPTVPSGSTEYDYLEVVCNPSYGMVSVTDLPQERSSGARWTTKAHVWVAPSALAPGRVPYAVLLIEGQQKGVEPYIIILRAPNESSSSQTSTAKK